MPRVPFFRRTFRITRHQPDVPRDVAEEIDLYLDLRTEELIDGGLPPEEARRQAEAAFGDRQAVEDECQQLGEQLTVRRRRGELFYAIVDDVRRAARDLWRRPTFAVAACLTLAVCIALHTAVFAVVHSIVLAPLPLPEPDRLVTLFNSYPNAGFPRALNTAPEYFERRAAVTAFEEVALYVELAHTVGERDAARRVFSMNVTPSFFRVLGVAPHLGRTFTDDEMEPGNGQRAVIAYSLWQELFAGSPSAVGQDLQIAGEPFIVVGVMPEGFRVPGQRARLWLPLVFTEEQKSDLGRFDPYYQMLARLRPGATIEQAKAQVDAWNEKLVERVPAGYYALIEEAGGFDTRIVGFHQDLVRHVEPWLYLLWGGALFVLLIGGVSLANLILVRSIGRQRELVTRYVLGAGRRRLLRQLFTESSVLAVVGGGLGIGLGAASLRWFDIVDSYQLSRVGTVELDPAAAVLILLLAVIVMLVASVVTALATYRRDAFSVLRSGASTSSRRSLRLRGSLAVAQIAIACILLIGATLMSASLYRLLAIDPGFETAGVLTGAAKLSEAHYGEPTDRIRFQETLFSELRSLPGVTRATVASQLPFDNLGTRSLLSAEGAGAERRRGEDLIADTSTVIGTDFFSTLELPLITGRLFDRRDTRGSAPVMIVSESIAERFWGGAEAALGKRVYRGVDPYVGGELGEEIEWHTVIGVAHEIVQDDLTARPREGAFYIPYQQEPTRFMRLAIKTELPPYDLVPQVRQRLAAIDPEVVLFWVTTLEDSVAQSLVRFRIPMQILLVFAGVALLLAAVGVYGVLAQSVAQRAREIGIRMALGGSLAQIRRWVLRNMLVFVAAGVVLGLLGALPLTRLMTHLLYGVRPTDPAVFAGVGIIIALVALVAALLPARRATRIDPVKVLGAE